jgi:hypothetical protein
MTKPISALILTVPGHSATPMLGRFGEVTANLLNDYEGQQRMGRNVSSCKPAWSGM